MTTSGHPIYEFLKAHAYVVNSRTQQEPIVKPYAMPVAVSREMGSGGAIVAKQLAERLGFHFYDKELLEDIATHMKVPINVLNRLDEKPSGFLDLFGSSFLSGYSIGMSELERHLKLTVTGLLKMGNVVILGRGATLIASPGHALRLRVIAPFEQRVDNLSRRLHIAEHDARTRIHTVETERQAFHRAFFGKSDVQPDSFDLALNTQQLSIDECVELAVKAYHYIAEKESESGALSTITNAAVNSPT